MALISTADAKAYLRVSGSSEDSTISGLVASITKHFETDFGIVVDQGERSWTFDRFAELMMLPVTPVAEAGITISYFDPAGDEQELGGFRSVLVGHHRRILPAVGSRWPVAACAPGVITVTGQAGWADGQAPADIIIAGKLLLARWYDNRDGEVPKAVCDILDGYDLKRV